MRKVHVYKCGDTSCPQFICQKPDDEYFVADNKTTKFIKKDLNVTDNTMYDIDTNKKKDEE